MNPGSSTGPRRPAHALHVAPFDLGRTAAPFYSEVERRRIENPRAARIVVDFEKAGLLIHPAPTKNQTFARVYRLDTDLGKFVQELLAANGETDDEQAFARSARRLEAAHPPKYSRGCANCSRRKAGSDSAARLNNYPLAFRDPG